MAQNVYQDSEKKIILPDEIKFDNGVVVPLEDVQVQPVVDDERNIIALNFSAEVDGPTVTNHITFNPFGLQTSDIGLFEEDSDNYEHPDDRSYDVVEPLSDETLEEIQVKVK